FLLLPSSLTRRQATSWMLKALAMALVVTVPLMLLDVEGFVRSLLLYQVQQRFRPDALTFLAWANAKAWPHPSWIGYAAMLATVVVCLKRAKRNAFSFFARVAFTTLTFFAFGR